MALYLVTLFTTFVLVLFGAKRRRLQVGPVTVAYWVLGPERGEPWVMLHGLGAVAATWGPVLLALRGRCRLIVPELSELGGSQVPEGGLGVRDGVGVVAALLEKEFDGRPVTLTGLSLGGWLAVRLALHRPDLISRLILVDAGGYRHQDWDAIEALVRVRDLAAVDRLYAATFVHAPWYMRLSRPTFLRGYTSRAVVNVLDHLSEEDTFDDDDLRRLRMPAALIWGEKDGLFQLDCARRMLAALPNATLEVLPGCGHAVHMECPRRLAAALLRVREANALSPPAQVPEGAPSSV